MLLYSYSYYSIPGIDEATALASAISHIESGKYDLIVFDTAPTGHTLKLLALPDIIQVCFYLVIVVHFVIILKYFLNKKTMAYFIKTISFTGWHRKTRVMAKHCLGLLGDNKRFWKKRNEQSSCKCSEESCCRETENIQVRSIFMYQLQFKKDKIIMIYYG